MRQELLRNTPSGADGAAQKKWMDIHRDIFNIYLKHFTKFAKPSMEEPILFIIHNHMPHISLKVINYCREKGIVIGIWRFHKKK